MVETHKKIALYLMISGVLMQVLYFSTRSSPDPYSKKNNNLIYAQMGLGVMQLVVGAVVFRQSGQPMGFQHLLPLIASTVALIVIGGLRLDILNQLSNDAKDTMDLKEQRGMNIATFVVSAFNLVVLWFLFNPSDADSSSSSSSSASDNAGDDTTNALLAQQQALLSAPPAASSSTPISISSTDTTPSQSPSSSSSAMIPATVGPSSFTMTPLPVVDSSSSSTPNVAASSTLSTPSSTPNVAASAASSSTPISISSTDTTPSQSPSQMNQATTPLPPVVDSSSQKVTFRNGIRITSNPKDMKLSPSLSPSVDMAQQQQVLQQMVPVNVSSSSTATGNTPTTSPVPMVQNVVPMVPNVPVQNAATSNMSYNAGDYLLPTSTSSTVAKSLPAPPEVITPQGGSTAQTKFVPRSVFLLDSLFRPNQAKLD